MSSEQVGDELEIRNLLARVAQYADSGDLDDYLDLYTDDATWEMPESPAIGLAASTRRGRADIRAGVEERRAAGVQGPGSDSLHVITTIRVEVDGSDVAHGHAYWMYWAGTSTAPTVTSMGRYHDEFRRTPNGWRLAHRTIVMG